MARWKSALREQERHLVMPIMLDRQNKRYHLLAWVIMGNHVRTVVSQSSGCQLSQIV
jgi:hypothetical protein